MDTQTLINKITKAINYSFKSDGTSPGLTISWLPRQEQYYTSIVRWASGEKEVVCSVSHADLNLALTGLSKRFLEENPAPINPIDELGSFLNENSN